MINGKFNSLGIDLALPVPATVEEFELNAGGGTTAKVGSCLAEAINNVIYRGSLADFRSNFLNAVEAMTANERKTKPTGKKTKTKVKTITDGKEVETEVEEDQLQYDETEGQYFGRVCAEAKVKPPTFQALADLTILGIKELQPDKTLVINEDRKGQLAAFYTSLGRPPETLDAAVEEAIEAIGTGITFDASGTARVEKGPKKTAKAYLNAADQIIASGQADVIAAKLTKILGSAVASDRESLGKAIQLWDARKRAEEQKKIAANLQALQV